MESIIGKKRRNSLQLLLATVVLLGSSHALERRAGAAGVDGQAGAGEGRAAVSPEQIARRWSAVEVSIRDKQGSGRTVTVQVPLGGAGAIEGAPLKIAVLAFMPDFALEATEIISKSLEANNPAARMRLTERGEILFNGWFFSNRPDMHHLENLRYEVRLLRAIPAVPGVGPDAPPSPAPTAAPSQASTRLPRDSGPGKVDSAVAEFLLAARWGNLDVIRRYIEGGGDLDWGLSVEGWKKFGPGTWPEPRFPGPFFFSRAVTALQMAVLADQPAVALLLLSAGVDRGPQSSGGDSTLLMLAAERGQQEIVQRLLQEGADAAAIDKQRQSALFFAASAGHASVVKLLLEAGADPNQESTDGELALARAIREGHRDVASLLVDHGADPDRAFVIVAGSARGETDQLEFLLKLGASGKGRDGRGRTPLMAAVSAGDQRLVEFLLQRGADPNARDGQGRTALHLHPSVWPASDIIIEGIGILQNLLVAGGDIEAIDGAGRTPLLSAATERRFGDMAALIQMGANRGAIGQDGKTAFDLVPNEVKQYLTVLAEEAATSGATFRAVLDRTRIFDHRNREGGFHVLELAARLGRLELVESLVHDSSGLDLKDTDRSAPALLGALDNRHREIARILLKAGADAESVSPPHGTTALITAARSGDLEMVKELVERGAYIHFEDWDWEGSRRPLFAAAAGGNAAVIAWLLDQGANPNWRNNRGDTPLAAAAAGGHTEAVRLLLQRGAKLNRAFVTAPRFTGTSHEAFKVLLPFGPDLGARDEKGNTPLHHASSSCNVEALRLLIAHGAVVDARNQWGRTPLRLALENCSTRIVELLLQAGASPDLPDEEGITPLEAKRSHGDDCTALMLRKSVNPNAGPPASPPGAVTVEEFVAAAGSGNLETMRRYLGAGGGVNASRGDGGRALVRAAEQGLDAAVRLLLEAGAEVNLPENDKRREGITALMAAGERKRWATVRLLVEAGADVEAASPRSPSVLSWAAAAGDLAMVRFLVDAGAEVHGPIQPLGFASRNGHPEVVRFLLGRGARVTAFDLAGAALSGNEEVMRLLIEAGADLDAALPIAASDIEESGALPVVQRLLALGARVDGRDGRGRTALLEAVHTTDTVLVDLLLRAGADPTARDHQGAGVLHVVLPNPSRMTGELPPLSLAETLIERGAPLEVRDSWGRTPLARATDARMLPMVKLLLAHGADPNADDARGRTPLHRAVDKRVNAEVLGALLDAGGDLGRKDSLGHPPQDLIPQAERPAWEKRAAESARVRATRPR